MFAPVFLSDQCISATMCLQDRQWLPICEKEGIEFIRTSKNGEWSVAFLGPPLPHRGRINVLLRSIENIQDRPVLEQQVDDNWSLACLQSHGIGGPVFENIISQPKHKANAPLCLSGDPDLDPRHGFGRIFSLGNSLIIPCWQPLPPHKTLLRGYPSKLTSLTSQDLGADLKRPAQ